MRRWRGAGVDGAEFSASGTNGHGATDAARRLPVSCPGAVQAAGQARRQVYSWPLVPLPGNRRQPGATEANKGPRATRAAPNQREATYTPGGTAASRCPALSLAATVSAWATTWSML